MIAAFDAQDTLGEQLDALAGQDVSFPFEVLVCDNGSRDRTVEVVRRYQQSHPWLRLIDASARRGPSAARNIGASQALAPLLAFCDADDVIADGWLAGMHAALQNDEFVTGAWEGERLNARNRASVSWMATSVYTMPYMPWLPGTGAGTMGIHRSVFEEARGFDEALATNEDTDLAWRVQLAGHRLCLHPEIVLHVRKRDGLREIFRQAYAYGAGDELLRHRFADVIAAFKERDAAGAVATNKSAPVDEPTRARPVRRLGQMIVRVLIHRESLFIADRVHRWGYQAGARHARSGGFAVSKVSVPDQLPESA